MHQTANQFVVPAQAGTQKDENRGNLKAQQINRKLDSRLRGNDGSEEVLANIEALL